MIKPFQTVIRCTTGLGVVMATNVMLAGDATPAAAASAEQPKGNLTRNGTYWRGEREESPGPFLCQTPAATDVTVVCDRWPDGSDLRQFGLDAIRLSGAKTEHEKCLAVWRWVRRFTMCTDGTPPLEPLDNPRQSPNSGGYINDPLKQLDVYGAHWCDGLSQTVACIWRALGYRAEKYYLHGHTNVDCFYRDFDGVERWHVLDVSDGGFVLDGSGQRVMSPEEMITDFFSDYCFGYLHCQHTAMPTFRTELSFRQNEKLERIWGSWQQPWQNNVGKQSLPDSEHGPYRFGFGNGRWTYAPELSKPDWTSGLAATPEGMAKAKLTPAEAGKPATAVWRFRTPYIISDAEVKIKFARKDIDDTVRLHLSVDDGQTWKMVWECPTNFVGEKEMVASICEKFKVANTIKPPEGFNSPFGRYNYRLKLELASKDAPADCHVDSIAFRTTVQQNFYSLPQLQPGKNAITVKGNLATGAALKVTYIWDDPSGKNRRNVTVVEQTPFTYEIIAGGTKWEDCVCKAITVEAVTATGLGNRTEDKELPVDFAALPPLEPAADTRVKGGSRPDLSKLPPLQQLVDDLNVKTPAKAGAAINALMALREPKAFESIKAFIYEVQPPAEYNNPLNGVKDAALVALYVSDREKSRPVLLDILSEPSHSKWKEVPRGLQGNWTSCAAIIGFLAADAGWKEFTLPLVKALQAPVYHADVPRGILRPLGRLGDARAADAIRHVLETDKDADDLQLAALAAGQIGDRKSIPLLRPLLEEHYAPCRCNAALALGMLKDKESAPVLRTWLFRTEDENYRGAAAEALSEMGDKESIPALGLALQVEPFPWVREKIAQSLGKLR
jgi:hypothetical protein